MTVPRRRCHDGLNAEDGRKLLFRPRAHRPSWRSAKAVGPPEGGSARWPGRGGRAAARGQQDGRQYRTGQSETRCPRTCLCLMESSAPLAPTTENHRHCSRTQAIGVSSTDPEGWWRYMSIVHVVTCEAPPAGHRPCAGQVFPRSPKARRRTSASEGETPSAKRTRAASGSRVDTSASRMSVAARVAPVPVAANRMVRPTIRRRTSFLWTSRSSTVATVV